MRHLPQKPMNQELKTLKKIQELNVDNYYDYMIMLDMDDVNASGKFIESINTCFEYNPNQWSVLTGNQAGLYYDLWALRKKYDMEFDCWKEVIYNNRILPYFHVTNTNIIYPQEILLEVDSAFGGIGIYKLSDIPNSCNYVGKYDDETEKCEHVEFNECIKQNGGNIYINGSFLTN